MVQSPNSGTNPSSEDDRSNSKQSQPRNVHAILQNRYEIVSHLGQGGMGTVYMARDLRLANTFCVVKKLRDDFFREEDKQKALEFFTREAMLLSQLKHKHPNIVGIDDYFKEDDRYYLVMEYIDGENLHQMLTRRGEAFDEDQVLQWATQVASVLEFLHSNNPKVIYRDLKPSNVMITKQGQVKLVDFGIARPYVEESDNTHVVSAGYSPPEQYWGAADPRSDIYALGATMFFLLTGQEPLALQVCSPKNANPKISERTNLVVERATAQDVWLRYQTAHEMAEELYKQPQKKFARLAVKAGTVFIVLFVVGCGFFGIMQMMHPADSEQASSDPVVRELESKIKQRDVLIQQKTQLLKAYQTVHDGIIRPPQSAVGETTSKSQGVAFKEMDEAQMTDPDGLAPVESESQHR